MSSTVPAQPTAAVTQPVPQATSALTSQAKQEKKKKPTVKHATGVLSTIQLRFQKDLTITSDQQRTGYYLDIASLIELADNVESVVRDQHRRGGHPAALMTGGIFFKLLAAKLQKVGVETNQIRVNNDCWILTEGLELPVCVSQCVSQFGKAFDGTGVELFPIVTDRLIIYINHLANCYLSDFGLGAARNPVNHRSFIEDCYGEIDQQIVALRRLADRLNIGAVKLDSHDAAGVLEMQTSILLSWNAGIGNVLLQADLARLLANNVVGDIFLRGGAVPNPDTLFVVPLIPALQAVRGVSVNAGNPFPVAALPVALTAMIAGLPTPLQRSCFQQKRFLNSIYNCSAPAISVTGTLAPLILVDTAARYVSASSFCFQCPPRDYVMAMSMLGTTQIIVKDHYGTVFNIANSAARVLPHGTSKMSVSFIEAQIAVLDECIIARK